MLDSIANGHIHALLPCCDLFQSLCHPFDLPRAFTPKGWFFKINTIFHFSLTMWHVIYHSPSVIFLIFRIQEETYWNSFAIHFSEQYNSARSTKASLHIYELRFSNNTLPRQSKISPKPHSENCFIIWITVCKHGLCCPIEGMAALC